MLASRPLSSPALPHAPCPHPHCPTPPALTRTAPRPLPPLPGIPKLEDANDAGGRNSEHCTLILTEGDSAKSLAVAGLSVVGRDRFGVFPLRGKLLNVRDASAAQITGNAEIQAIKQILGLQVGLPGGGGRGAARLCCRLGSGAPPRGRSRPRACLSRLPRSTARCTPTPSRCATATS